MEVLEVNKLHWLRAQGSSSTEGFSSALFWAAEGVDDFLRMNLEQEKELAVEKVRKGVELEKVLAIGRNAVWVGAGLAGFEEVDVGFNER